MPSGSGAKRFLILGLIIVLALLISGLITGAIGAGFVQSDADKSVGKTAEGIIPKPEVHLPAQTAFPARDRGDYLDFLAAEELEQEKYALLRALFSKDGNAREHALEELKPRHRLLLLKEIEDLDHEFGGAVLGPALADAFLDDPAAEPELDGLRNDHESEQHISDVEDSLRWLLSLEIDRLEAEEAAVAAEPGEHQHQGPVHEAAERGPFSGLGFIVTNTLLSSWIATVLILAIFILGVRKSRLIPGRFQNFCEIVVEALMSFVEGVVGRERARLVFPIIATIFLFVIVNAWIGLLPIYQSLGFVTDGEIQVHLLRPAGTDLNMPLALALVSFFFVELLGFRLLGLGYLSKFIRIGSLKRGVAGLFRGNMMEAFQGFMDFGFVGPLEAFSELVRVISFTFRLFGNMTAGEILVLVSAFLVPFVATIGVYGLELLVGLVQALIFAGLTLVFAAVAMAPHAEEEH